MSGTRPPARGAQPAVSLSEGRISTQGMIGPQQFVYGDGDLTAVSFRFLNSMFNSVQQLQADVATLQQRLTAAGIP